MDNHQQPDYGQYGWYAASAQTPTEAPNIAEAQVAPQPEANMARFRRYAAAGVLAIAMIAGGSAVVMAASPDPSASPTPGATSGQDGSNGSSGGTTDDGTTTPRAGHPCPNGGSNGTDDGSSSDSSSNSTTNATAL